MSKRESMAENQSPNLIEAAGLSKRFGNVLALDSINFGVRKGEIHCLLGENGAGKTTLAECLYGFYKPDAGKIIYNGKSAEIASPRDAMELGIGMVHQHFTLVDSHTVIENLILDIAGNGLLLNIKEAEEKIREICKLYEVDLDPNVYVWQLSVGQQQWVEILKALLLGIDLLILDEPTAVLTPQETIRLFSVLNRMKSEGLSIIFITHKLNEVIAVSDRVTVLRKGKLIGSVDTRDVTKEDLALMMVGREVVFRIQKDNLEQGQPTLTISDLYAYDDRELPALKGINLTVHQHEILGIAGVSGNGQKELFEVIIGVRSATQGLINLGNESILNNSPSQILAKGVGRIPGDRNREGLILDFTIAENLILGRQWQSPYLHGLNFNNKEIKNRAINSLAQYEIMAPSIDCQTKKLSGGNLQKVILARELGHPLKVLIAYQPCRGLDVGATEFVHRQLLEKRKSGAAILLISEDLEEIFNLSDTITVIYRGKITGQFTASEAQLNKVGLLMAGIESQV